MSTCLFNGVPKGYSHSHIYLSSSIVDARTRTHISTKSVSTHSFYLIEKLQTVESTRLFTIYLFVEHTPLSVSPSLAIAASPR